MPLAESRGSASGGVWGNAPTVPRATSMPNVLNKGAGSEASLPVTLRVRRRAHKLLFPPRFREEPIKTGYDPFAIACFACTPYSAASFISAAA